MTVKAFNWLIFVACLAVVLYFYTVPFGKMPAAFYGMVGGQFGGGNDFFAKIISGIVGVLMGAVVTIAFLIPVALFTIGTVLSIRGCLSHVCTVRDIRGKQLEGKNYIKPFKFFIPIIFFGALYGLMYLYVWLTPIITAL